MTSARRWSLDLDAPASGSRRRPTSRSRSRRSSRSSIPRRSSSRTRFEELREAAAGATRCSPSRSRGELIDTEIEIRSGRSETLRRARSSASASAARRLFALAGRARRRARARPAPIPGRTTSTRRSSTPPHYRRLRDELGWVAQRNNTWSLHVHVGVRGADRAVAVCDRLRDAAADAARAVGELAVPRRARHRPALGSHARSSPAASRAAGSTSRSATGTTYADFVDLLERTNSIVESTQLWWSVRPAPRLRHRRGADLRRADPRRGVVRAGRADRRLRRPGGARLRRRARWRPPLAGREIEENLWRAIRYGLDGRMIDFDRGDGDPDAARRSSGWSRGRRRRASSSGIEVRCRSANGAQRARRARGRRDDPRDLRATVADDPDATSRRPDGCKVSDAMSDEQSQTHRSRPRSGRRRAASPSRSRCCRESRRRCARCASRTCVAQSVVSILNLSARRIAKEDERDLEQARVGIDAVRALVDAPRRRGPAARSANALSQLQMLYAQARGAGDEPGPAGPGGPAAAGRRRRRPAEARRRRHLDSRLGLSPNDAQQGRRTPPPPGRGILPGFSCRSRTLLDARGAASP